MLEKIEPLIMNITRVAMTNVFIKNELQLESVLFMVNITGKWKLQNIKRSQILHRLFSWLQLCDIRYHGMYFVTTSNASEDGDAVEHFDRQCQYYACIKWEYWSTMQKIKHNWRHENKVNENKVLYCKALRCETINNNKKVVFPYVKLTNLLF